MTLRAIVLYLFDLDLLDPETQNKLVSYTSGHLLTSTVVFSSMTQLLALSVLKVIFALVIGVIGGIGGLLSKDLYSWAKNRYFN